MDRFINFSNTSLSEALQQLDNTIKDYTSQSFTYLYLDNDSPKNRLLLRNLVQQFGSLRIILVSGNKNLANLAWTANVYHFLLISGAEIIPPFSLLKERLFAAFNKNEIPKKLKIPFKGGMDVIETRDICFCTGEGNYSVIYLTSGIKKTVTLQLHILQKNLCIVPAFQRIGKSIIINVDKISKIKENSVYLSSEKDALKLNLSALYIKRLKKTIMWY